MIPQAYRDNFNTMLRAAKNGDLALVESKDAKTGEPRYLIAAIQHENDYQVSVVPFGHMANGNPYEEYADPTELAPPSKENVEMGNA